jgi:hypothetical protein
MATQVSIAEEIKALELDTISAQKWGSKGKIEAWVRHYLSESDYQQHNKTLCGHQTIQESL